MARQRQLEIQTNEERTGVWVIIIIESRAVAALLQIGKSVVVIVEIVTLILIGPKGNVGRTGYRADKELPAGACQIDFNVINEHTIDVDTIDSFRPDERNNDRGIGFNRGTKNELTIGVALTCYHSIANFQFKLEILLNHHPRLHQDARR